MIHYGDCLEIMPNLPDKSIDMILCDLPYGTTACKWDTIIPFEPLWKQYKRLIKDNGAIVLTASQPFTSALVMSNPTMFRYEWIWEKDRPSNPLVANKRVMPRHENVCIFYSSQPTYNPQKEVRKEENKRNNKKDTAHNTDTKGNTILFRSDGNTDLIHPSSVQKFTYGESRGIHPTQKPVALFEYLIRTYTNEGDTVLDNCAGSGTTGIAAMNTNRKFILIEKDAEYFSLISKRLDEHEPLFANTVSI
jgi:site-specific DNA-methyltransferase (adenine-specific)